VKGGSWRRKFDSERLRLRSWSAAAVSLGDSAAFNVFEQRVSGNYSLEFTRAWNTNTRNFAVRSEHSVGVMVWDFLSLFAIPFHRLQIKTGLRCSSPSLIALIYSDLH